MKEDCDDLNNIGKHIQEKNKEISLNKLKKTKENDIMKDTFKDKEDELPKNENNLKRIQKISNNHAVNFFNNDNYRNQNQFPNLKTNFLNNKIIDTIDLPQNYLNTQKSITHEENIKNNTRNIFDNDNIYQKTETVLKLQDDKCDLNRFMTNNLKIGQNPTNKGNNFSTDIKVPENEIQVTDINETNNERCHRIGVFSNMHLKSVDISKNKNIENLTNFNNEKDNEKENESFFSKGNKYESKIYQKINNKISSDINKNINKVDNFQVVDSTKFEVNEEILKDKNKANETIYKICISGDPFKDMKDKNNLENKEIIKILNNQKDLKNKEFYKEQNEITNVLKFKKSKTKINLNNYLKEKEIFKLEDKEETIDNENANENLENKSKYFNLLNTKSLLEKYQYNYSSERILEKKNTEQLSERNTSVNFISNLNIKKIYSFPNENNQELSSSSFNKYQTKMKEISNSAENPQDENNRDFLHNFRNGELKRRIEFDDEIQIIKEKIDMNDNLRTDKDFERNLDLLTHSKEERKLSSKNYNSNLSSDEGDEFYDSKRLKENKTIFVVNGRVDNHSIKNTNKRKNNIKKDLKNKIRKKSNANGLIKRRNSTPIISYIDRGGLLNMLNKRLEEESNEKQLNNIYAITQNPQEIETDKENQDISDRSIMQYLMNNHFLDDSQGIVYNPTFLGNFVDKNINDTNNKILLEYSKKNRGQTPSNSRNLINKKISINDIKNLIKDRNITNSIGENKKNGLNSRNELEISNEQHKNINSNISIKESDNIDDCKKKIKFDLKNEFNISKNEGKLNKDEMDKIKKEILCTNYKKDKNSDLKEDKDSHHDSYFADISKPKKKFSMRNTIDFGEISKYNHSSLKENGVEMNKHENKDNIKESDERRFLSKETKKSKDDKNSGRSTKRETIRENTNLDLVNDPTKDIFKKSLEKGKKLNLNKVMEHLENIIHDNEKNRKKSLLNLIELKRTGTNYYQQDNLQYKVMNLGVLIEGDSISHCLDDDLKDLFWNIVKNSKSVVCCRCSPKQKAEVVGFVKKQSKEVTLAIGDGGNDIPMIKIANIGVGIFGKEGYQAAFNSDYAISQFKYLKRLIFVHGRNSLLRNSYFIYFFFFKNVLFTLSQLWFCFFSGFSGQVNTIKFL